MEAKDIIAKVKRLEIRTRKAVDDFVAGAYHSVFKGKGIEFDEVREYVEGDEIRDIDWNVTARMNAPYVKRFVEERQLTVLLVVDVSRSLRVPGMATTKIRMATELAALLAFGAIRNGDRVGLILFSEDEELHLRPKKGRRHGMRLIREMIAHEPASTGTSLANALTGLMQSNYRRSIVFLISDFMDDGYEHALKLVAEKHDLVAFRLIDRADFRLPEAGLVVLENAEGGDQKVLGGGTDSAYGKGANEWYERTGKTIVRAGVDLVDLESADELLAPLMRFFRRREGRGGRNRSTRLR